jgi:hypothetical protein
MFCKISSPGVLVSSARKLQLHRKQQDESDVKCIHRTPPKSAVWLMTACRFAAQKGANKRRHGTQKATGRSITINLTRLRSASTTQIVISMMSLGVLWPMHRLSVCLIFGVRDLSSLARTHTSKIWDFFLSRREKTTRRNKWRAMRRHARRGRRMMRLLALRQTNLREMFAMPVQESASPLLRLFRFVEWSVERMIFLKNIDVLL